MDGFLEAVFRNTHQKMTKNNSLEKGFQLLLKRLLAFRRLRHV